MLYAAKMKIPMWLDCCIICRKPAPSARDSGFSEEHVIPKSLGGILSCNFLCKACNDSFGSSFEAKAKQDPSIRLAISALRDKLPELFEKIETRQIYSVGTEIGRLTAYYRKGSITSGGTRLLDGSFLVPDNATAARLGKMLSKDGLERYEFSRVQPALMK